jgi:hypothetical protein
MSNTKSVITIIILLIFFCSYPNINCQKSKLGKNLKVEFESVYVNNGLLEKFAEYFEDTQGEIEYEDEAEAEDQDGEYTNTQEEYYDDEEEGEEYMEEEELSYLDGEETLGLIIHQTKAPKPEDNLYSTEFTQFATKVCLLTAVSKETKIYVKEYMSL